MRDLLFSLSFPYHGCPHFTEHNWMYHVYTDDGLVVGWKKVLERKQLNAEVWQILILGSQPSNLQNSQNAKIIIEY